MSDVNTLLMENKLLRKLGTRQGFFQYYFEQLPKFPTNVECFNSINDLHVDLYGEERFSDYNSFRISLSRMYKK